MIQGCGVCQEKTSKYKCPKCYTPFCSVDCGKIHKDSPSCSVDERDTNRNIPLPVHDFITEHTVPADKLALLRENAKLKGILKNRSLRDTLLALNSSATPESMLEEAMKDDAFRDFVDTCLAVVDPENGTSS